MQAKKLFFLAALYYGVCDTVVLGGFPCSHPPPAPNYSNDLYQGRWYEIGKVKFKSGYVHFCLKIAKVWWIFSNQIQTAGGAIFQAGTVCTIATYDPYDLNSGGGDIGYCSRDNNTMGPFVNATGK